MTAPTIVEENLLKEFRLRVKDVIKTKEHNEDSYLIRWLRARDLNLQKSEDMLRSHFQWREENNIDQVLKIELDPFCKQEFPFYINGIDKNSQPVIFIPIGKWDFRKVISEGKTEEFKVYVNNMFEQLLDKIRERNKKRDRDLYPVTQFTSVVDWGGYSYMQLVNLKAVQTMLQIAQVYEAHYPEILFQCFCINCPSFFNLVLALIKPILAPKTMSKLNIYGWERKEWERALREQIDVDQLSLILKPLELIKN